MKVISFNALEKERWDAACDHSSEAWLFHQSNWIEVETEHFVLANLSFALEERGNIVAVQPLYLSDPATGSADELLLHSGIHRHTGFACIDSLNASGRKAAQSIVMNHIFELAKSNNVDRIQLNSQNLSPVNQGESREEIPFWVKEYGFHFGLNFSQSGMSPAPGMSTLNADQQIVLDIPEDDIFSRLESSCRRAIRKAEKASIVFEVGEGAVIDRYYALAQASAKRTGESLAPKSYFEALWKNFGQSNRCYIFFARHDHHDVAALLIGVEKHAATYLGGISDSKALTLRVNDFIHWRGMLWLKDQGVAVYRLGPVFPELPEDWPIVKVSRFKKKFGGNNVPIIQGSYFLNPGRYLERGIRTLEVRCKFKVEKNHVNTNSIARVLAPEQDHAGLDIIFKSFGLLRGAYDFSARQYDIGSGGCVVFLFEGNFDYSDISVKEEDPGGYLYNEGRRSSLFRRRKPAYKPLLDYVSFEGNSIEPIWVNSDGRAVVAWHNQTGKRNLLIGLNVVEEMVRYRQGDPEKVNSNVETGGYGFDFERPMYLYNDQVDSSYPHVPWSDQLGFVLVENIARLTGVPLLNVLPSNSKGLVILTGDDDQACLEKYDEQLACINDVPITYFLVSQTRHTRETLGKLPDTVEIGIHPDALDDPENYDDLCEKQTGFIENLTQSKIRTVRNHGFLNKGYWGHLKAWQDSGIEMDVNCPGIDGTALNGSLLPMQVRDKKGKWVSHRSLLTAFGDGMFYGVGLSIRQCLARIRRSIHYVENNTPGVLVFNMHPQNISDTYKLHKEIVKLAHKKGWTAMGLDSYINWLDSINSLTVINNDSSDYWEVITDSRVANIGIRIPSGRSWKTHVVSELNAEKSFVVNLSND